MRKKTQKNRTYLIGLHCIRITFLTVLILGFKNNANAQTGSVGIGTTTPYTNAILDVSSTSKGVLLPRLTDAQRTTLTPVLNLAANGLLIYNVTTLRFNYWDGTKWNDVGLAGVAGAAGKDGTEWFAGQGVPSNTTGKVTDFYLDGITGDVYKKNPATPANPTGEWSRFGAANPVNLKNTNKKEINLALPAVIPAGTSYTQTFTYSGATVGSAALCSPKQALQDGLIIAYARVSTSGTVEVKFYNAGTTTATLPAGDYEIVLF